MKTFYPSFLHIWLTISLSKNLKSAELLITNFYYFFVLNLDSLNLLLWKNFYLHPVTNNKIGVVCLIKLPKNCLSLFIRVSPKVQGPPEFIIKNWHRDREELLTIDSQQRWRHCQRMLGNRLSLSWARAWRFNVTLSLGAWHC